jgi:FkbM family methyltransferase
MVEAGETVVVCGVWQKGTIKQYSSIVGPTGRVVFIEANPDTVERLSRITADMSWVTWVNRAVWSEPREMPFVRSLTDRHSWDRVLDEKAKGTFPYEKVAYHEEITVFADTIDNIMRNLGIKFIDHLNLTVNRCEFEALEGARGIIEASPDMRLRLPSRVGEIRHMVKTIKDMGFTVHVADLPMEWQNRKGRKRYRVYAMKDQS